MFGAVSSTEDVRESGKDEVEGWYDRDMGEGGLRDSYDGKPGSFWVGDLSIAFLLGMVREGCGRSLRAASASRSRSTMPDSARACLPTSDGASPSPSVAAVLSMVEESSEMVSGLGGFLREEYRMSMGKRRGMQQKVILTIRSSAHRLRLSTGAWSALLAYGPRRRRMRAGARSPGACWVLWDGPSAARADSSRSQPVSQCSVVWSAVATVR